MKRENCAKNVKETLTSVEGINDSDLDLDLADKLIVIEASNESIKLVANTEKYNVVGIEIV